LIPTKLLKYVAARDYNNHLLEPGVLYRDSNREPWPLGPSGTNTMAPGKEGKAE
jgi:hypothetical protein